MAEAKKRKTSDATLPDEIDMDILSRLTVKDILRCCLIIKEWRNYHQDTHLVNLNLSRRNKETVVVFLDQGIFRTLCYSVSSSRFLLPREDREISAFFGTISMGEFLPRLENCCKGLVAFKSTINHFQHLYICNPVLEKFVKVYPPEGHRVFSTICALFFDAQVNDFKIITSDAKTTFVYSMRSKAWHEVTSLPPSSSYDRRVVSIGNLLYWVGRPVINAIRSDHTVLFSFHIQQELFSIVKLPEDEEFSNQLFTPSKLHGKLCLSRVGGSAALLWVRNDKYEWDKICIKLGGLHLLSFAPICDLGEKSFLVYVMAKSSGVDKKNIIERKIMTVKDGDVVGEVPIGVNNIEISMVGFKESLIDPNN